MRTDVAAWSRGRFLATVTVLVVLSFMLDRMAFAPQLATPLRAVAGLLALTCLTMNGVVFVRWIRARNREEGF